MDEYLILFMLLGVSLVILGLLVRVFLKVKHFEDTAGAKVVKLEPSERAAPEAFLVDIEEDVEEK